MAKRSWVEDVKPDEVLSKITKYNNRIAILEIKSPLGSRYESGEPKSEGNVGIYFVDPTG